VISVSLFLNSETKEIAAGDVIFSAGQPGRTMYVVIEGEVDIWLGPVFAETVVEGGIFGEMALIDNHVRSADAIARTECKLISVDQEQFRTLIREEPSFALQVMGIMAERLRRANARIIES